MSKKTLLKDKEGNELAPLTLTNCVYDDNGKGLEELLPRIEEVVDDTTFPQIETLTREELSKDLFIKLWNSACTFKDGTWTYIAGKYNEETGFFELNGITDITYEEAIAIYQFRIPTLYFQYDTQHSNYHPVRQIWSMPLRTVFPLVTNDSVGTMFNYFSMLSSVKVLAVASPKAMGLPIFNMNNAFQVCRSLVEIKGKMDVSLCTNFVGWLYLASELKEFDLYGLKVNISIAGLSKASFNSVNLLVSQALNTTPITITVHANVYSALTGSASYPFNGGTQEEWEQLLQDATNKQITFAAG